MLECEKMPILLSLLALFLACCARQSVQVVLEPEPPEQHPKQQTAYTLQKNYKSLPLEKAPKRSKERSCARPKQKITGLGRHQYRSKICLDLLDITW
ncbi:hypothetical protein NHP190012_00920 [Helicobacter sp. NHP19-012]|uniref:Lipoprotein n=1 Tax=Helicobacter gastrofelis TaxID=2849642 RepID=A0ABN6I4J4_9HELI|nr:hypothetical protein NHP190012_00920 [Helicobacter sp. NHP19-012]